MCPPGTEIDTEIDKFKPSICTYPLEDYAATKRLSPDRTLRLHLCRALKGRIIHALVASPGGVAPYLVAWFCGAAPWAGTLERFLETVHHSIFPKCGIEYAAMGEYKLPLVKFVFRMAEACAELAYDARGALIVDPDRVKSWVADPEAAYLWYKTAVDEIPGGRPASRLPRSTAGPDEGGRPDLDRTPTGTPLPPARQHRAHDRPPSSASEYQGHQDPPSPTSTEASLALHCKPSASQVMRLTGYLQASLSSDSATDPIDKLPGFLRIHVTNLERWCLGDMEEDRAKLLRRAAATDPDGFECLLLRWEARLLRERHSAACDAFIAAGGKLTK